MMKNKILVAGSLNYDILLGCKRLPVKGETMPIDELAYASGGKGANQAVQCARLGLDTVMFGAVGSDPQGKYLVETVRNFGVNTDHILEKEGNTGICVIQHLQDGSVYGSLSAGANFKLSDQDLGELDELLEEASFVILQMEIPLEINRQIMKKAKEKGVRIILNAAPARAQSEDLLSLCDLLVVNEIEAEFYLGKGLHDLDEALEGARQLSEVHGCDVIVTLGEQGCAGFGPGTDSGFRLPACKVEAVETTGAGDSFVGALAYGLSDRMSLEQAAKLATKAAAFTVTRQGAQDAMPGWNELNDKSVDC